MLFLSFEREKIEALIKKAEELSEEGKKKDYEMPIIFPFIPAILIILGVLLFLGGLVFVRHPAYQEHFIIGSIAVSGIILFFLGIILNFYVIYVWIRRRNEHFSRTKAFYEAIAEASELFGFKRAFSIKSRLNEIKEINSKEKNAVLDTILTIIPFYIFYVYHYLNKDFAKHSKKEKLLLNEVLDELREKVPSFTRRSEELEEIPERSTFLYIILTLIIGGLFLIYWVYTLTEDPNRHFESHRIIEKDIITAMKELLPKE